MVTAATLGKDYSGNGNNWTPNNFSVTAGAGNDSLVDSPTSYGTDTGVGGTVRGNYCTLNPLVGLTGTRAFSNGNLQVSVTTDNVNTFATIAVPSSGKWYWEYQITTITVAPMGGVITGNDYATGGLFPAVRSNVQPDAFTMNFGQRAFANTAPSGFKALCTQNLPTPTIGATTATLANKYFDATLYTGTGSTLAVTNTGGFQPDWVWLKNRSNVAYHSIWDAVRGRSAGGLASNDTMAEQASTAGNDFVSFNSNGFSVGPAQNWNVDTNGNTYVGWQWKANGAGVTNTAGSITSTVSASTTSGFSVVTYTGTGANATVGHGLGVAPSMILIKSRSSVTNWNSYHIAVGASATIILNTTSGAVSGSTFFNSTAPTSTVFSLGSDGSTNPSGAQQVAYCFAPIAGYSAFGSYTGNGSADGPFIYTGFKPAFVLIKRCDTTSGGYWRILDDTRNTSNVVDKELYPNDTSAEGTFAALDFTSNGVKMRNSDPQYNTNNALYLYACFAETPLKFSLAR